MASLTPTPSISIPIYEIHSGTLTVPISISFFAEGAKLVSEPGPIGFGWSLLAGGTMARTIHGRPDDLSSFPPNGVIPSYLLSNQNDFTYLAQLYYPGLITENDNTVYD